jgi:hypothetical protein
MPCSGHACLAGSCPDAAQGRDHRTRKAVGTTRAVPSRFRHDPLFTRSTASCTVRSAAPMALVIAPTALIALGFSGAAFHEPFHAGRVGNSHESNPA